MLQERVRRWPERWKQEGLREGRLEGRQEGLQQGLREARLEALLQQRRVLVRLTQKRFGAELAALAGARLDSVADPGRLEELAEALLDCGTGEQWLKRIERALN